MSRSQSYSGSQAAQPENAYINVYYGAYSTSSSSRVNIYCCSNSSSSYIGSFREPYGSTYTSNFRDMRIERYSSSSAYAGCIRLEGYEPYYRSLNYISGIYTCNVQNRNGHTHYVNFALNNEYGKQKLLCLRQLSSIHTFQSTELQPSIASKMFITPIQFSH